MRRRWILSAASLLLAAALLPRPGACSYERLLNAAKEPRNYQPTAVTTSARATVALPGYAENVEYLDLA